LFPFRLSVYQFGTMLVYKEFIEISGHCGKWLKSGSFVQFVWLPKLLGIQLFAQDHHLHHKLLRFNYSKRFALWDKVFNTYQSSPAL
jgi:sterol desaturase/sphingolipid hydroxylase (fatty acid hydroxylase superfamily)